MHIPTTKPVGEPTIMSNNTVSACLYHFYDLNVRLLRFLERSGMIDVLSHSSKFCSCGTSHALPLLLEIYLSTILLSDAQRHRASTACKLYTLGVNEKRVVHSYRPLYPLVECGLSSKLGEITPFGKFAGLIHTQCCI